MRQKGFAGGSGCSGSRGRRDRVLGVLSERRGATKTLYLDRLTMGGAPDDGIAIWRPYVAPRSVSSRRWRSASPESASPEYGRSAEEAASRQLLEQAGFLAVHRLHSPWEPKSAAASTFMATLPFRALPRGSIPRPPACKASAISQPFALMDLRLDIRGLVYRSDDKRWLFGAGMSFFIPTGAQYSYGGDGATSHRAQPEHRDVRPRPHRRGEHRFSFVADRCGRRARRRQRVDARRRRVLPLATGECRVGGSTLDVDRAPRP